MTRRVVDHDKIEAKRLVDSLLIHLRRTSVNQAARRGRRSQGSAQLEYLLTFDALAADDQERWSHVHMATPGHPDPFDGALGLQLRGAFAVYLDRQVAKADHRLFDAAWHRLEAERPDLALTLRLYLVHGKTTRDLAPILGISYQQVAKRLRAGTSLLALWFVTHAEDGG